MKKYLSLLAFVLTSTFSTQAFANYYCTGNLTYLGLDAGGTVVVAQNGLSIHAICNIANQGSYTMIPAACKTAYGALLAAKAIGKPITLYYTDNSFTCNTIPSWGNMPQFYFLEMQG
jgi:hypothetical protein